MYITSVLPLHGKYCLHIAKQTTALLRIHLVIASDYLPHFGILIDNVPWQIIASAAGVFYAGQKSLASATFAID